MSTKVRVILNSPEQHPVSGMPKALRHVLYSNDPLLELIEWNGCPNSGCSHNLSIVGEAHDVNAWLDVFAETYPTTMPEILMIKKRIREERLDSMGEEVSSITVELRKIKRFQEVNGGIVERPWFWTPEWEG